MIQTRLCGYCSILDRIEDSSEGNPDMSKVGTPHISKGRISPANVDAQNDAAYECLLKEVAQSQGRIRALLSALHVCRIHSSLRVTPAMEAGITDHIWTITELVKDIAHKNGAQPRTLPGPDGGCP